MKSPLNLLLACAGFSTLSALAVELKADMDLTLTSSDGEHAVKEGGTIALPSNQATVVEAPGHMPILLVPFSPAVDAIHVKLKPWGLPESSPLGFTAALDGLIRDIVHVQALLRDKRPREALALAERLDSRFPGTRQLKMLRATCHVVLGEKSSASAILKEIPAGDGPGKAEP